MKVTIQKNEKTAKDENGNVYKINGLRVMKQESLPPVHYPFGSKMCTAVIFKGLKLDAILLPSGTEIDLL